MDIDLTKVLLPKHFDEADKLKAYEAIRLFYLSKPSAKKDYCLVENIKEGRVTLKFYLKEKVDALAKEIGVHFFVVIKSLWTAEKNGKS